MNSHSNTIVKINFSGGIVPAEQLRSLLLIVKSYGIEEIIFGERQNLFFSTGSSSVEEIRKVLWENHFNAEAGDSQVPNIVSSYAAINLFAPQSWLTESVLKEVLDTFDFQPRVRINIVDVQQGLVGAFDGEISFIPSPDSNFWYLYLRSPLDNRFICWPELIYSIELGSIAKELEKHLINVNEFSLSKIVDAVKKELDYISQEKKTELAVPRYILPNYEGIHRNGDHSWIGIKNRSGKFTTGFLTDVAELCMETSVGSIYLTPWRSLLAKNIKGNDLLRWEILLGKFGINIRHSSFELNWRTPDCDRHAEELKRYLIRGFDKTDVRTYGLTFAVTTEGAQHTGASVIIEMKPSITLFGKIHLFRIYKVYRTEDFNPNTLRLMYEGEVSEKRLLVDKLKLLCEQYYKGLAAVQTAATAVTGRTEHVPKKTKQYWTPQRMHKCKNCFTLYDPEFGDMMNGIEPGIEFHDLPETYVCSVCGAPKNEFIMVRKVLIKENG